MNTLKHNFSNWESFLSLLPASLEESAQKHEALIRKREVKSASSLLRLILGYAILAFSLKDLSIWALQIGFAKISPPALLKRFLKCVSWLKFLIGVKLSEKTSFRPPRNDSFIVRIFDASDLNRPGSKGSDLRLHAGLDLKTLQIDHLELSSFKKGESLTNFSFQPGDIAVVDRGYSHRRGVWHVVNSGAGVIVRLCWQNFPMQYPDGTTFDLFHHLRQLKGRDSCDVRVKTRATDKIPEMSGRFIAVRKDPTSCERARRRANQEAKKNGRALNRLTLEACNFMFLFTTLLENELTTNEVLEIYKLRWQIEMFFKRLKSVIDLDEIKARHDKLCETFLLGKLLVLLIIEQVLFQCNIFSSKQENLKRPISLWRAMKNLYKTLQCSMGLISDLGFWIDKFKQIIDRFRDSPRKRINQAAKAINFKELKMKKNPSQKEGIF